MNESLKNEAEKIFGPVRTSSDPVRSFDREELESKDRSYLAKVLVVSFLIGLGVIILFTPVYNCLVPKELRLDVFKMFTAYSGILGPFVGVIAGYFFKK